MRIGHIIEENIKEYNFSQKQVCLLTGISESELSSIINNKKDIDLELSTSLGKLFGLEPVSLLNMQMNYMKYDEKVTDQERVILDYYTSLNSDLKLASNVTLKKYVYNYFPTISLEHYKQYLNNNLTGFKMFKDKPLAFMWVAMMEHKYGNIKASGDFKSSTKDTIYKNVVNILLDKQDFKTRYLLVEKFLDTKGVVLRTGPFIPNSTIYGVSLKRGTQRLIFLSDMKKREYSFIVSLIHELVHTYEGKKDDEEYVNKNTIKILKKYYSASEHNRKDIEFIIENEYTNDQELNNEISEKIYLISKPWKVDFGKPESLL